MVFAAAVAVALLAPPVIRLERDASGDYVVHVSAAAGRDVSVAVDNDSAVPPLLGRTVKRGADTWFYPRFPLQPGARYRVTVHGPGQPVTVVTQVPAAAASPPTFVEQIYPSADELPENELKFYIHFSAPMSRGDAYRFIHLVDEQGRAVPDAFLHLDEELWDPGLRRFTLFFDPGRVKRDILPNRAMGAPLQAGHHYALVIDAGWPDAKGRPLRESHRKEFDVVAAWREIVDADRWQISAPPGATREPLVLEFPQPLDHALLERMITVRGAAGHSVDGAVTVDTGERRWQFMPAAPWKAGPYTLRIDSALEDIAGNTLERPFDTDLLQGGKPRNATGASVERPFRVR